MPDARSILIADDEDSFLRSTAELLRGDGYDCDAVADGRQAIEKLQTKRYDLLIADIKMPGNPNLELIKETRRLACGMPVILVTGYPAAETAIKSIELPVVAYLEKPVPYDELRRHVEFSLEHSQTYRTLSDVQKRLQDCIVDLEDAKRRRWSPELAEQKGTITVPAVTIRALGACVSELVNLEATGDRRRNTAVLCGLLDCPQWSVHRDILRRVVKALQETKRRFKSKELADVREAIERLLEESQKLSDSPLISARPLRRG